MEDGAMSISNLNFGIRLQAEPLRNGAVLTARLGEDPLSPERFLGRLETSESALSAPRHCICAKIRRTIVLSSSCGVDVRSKE